MAKKRPSELEVKDDRESCEESAVLETSARMPPSPGWTVKELEMIERKRRFLRGNRKTRNSVIYPS